jgi:hypothetical protein
MADGLVHAVLAYDEIRRNTVLFGGASREEGMQDATLVFDGVHWREMVVSGAKPSPRSAHAMAFDRKRGRVVLFSGWNGSTVGGTWEWDGKSWTEFTPKDSPPARHHSAMAFDEVRQRVVLFGGTSDGAKPLSDFWEWDGVTWTQIKVVLPPPRFRHALATDSKRQRIVLFGGLDSSPNGNVLDDTWEWDGSTWTLTTPTIRPPARHTAAMAYHGALARTVLFGGGVGATIALRDTWEWDGKTWAQQSPFLVPSARSGPASAYDVARARIVIYGGDPAAPIAHRDTWEYTNGNPPAGSAPFGEGCPGSKGPATLSSSKLPVLGKPFELRVDGAPRLLSALVYLGFSRDAWSNLPLPLDLTGLGLPKCSLLVSPDWGFHVSTGPGTSFTFSLPVPVDPVFAGIEFFNQVWVFDKQANAFGAFGTNGLASVIGF